MGASCWSGSGAQSSIWKDLNTWTLCNKQHKQQATQATSNTSNKQQAKRLWILFCQCQIKDFFDKNRITFVPLGISLPYSHTNFIKVPNIINIFKTDYQKPSNTKEDQFTIVYTLYVVMYWLCISKWSTTRMGIIILHIIYYSKLVFFCIRRYL